MAYKFWQPRIWIILGGLLFGILASLLTTWGNPPNMGFCSACFLRDITGSLGLHRADVVQYLRPEIIGLILGALFSSLIFREFKPRGGSSPLVRFFLGAFMMTGALVFLGCTVRAPLRLAGGDLNALTGIAGLIMGILAGITFLRQGFNLGRSGKVSRIAAFILPGISIALLLFLVFQPPFIYFSSKGPGSQHALPGIALAAGIIIGFIAQKTRMCFAGGWRDIFLVRDFYLFSGIAAFFAGALFTNYLTGNFASGLYHWGFENQPIAHNNHLWNFLSMSLVGLAATLLGGCPLRQMVLASEGDTDAGITFLGLAAGAAFAHNFLLASSAQGTSVFGPFAVLAGLVFCLLVGFSMMDRGK
ncbi:MAG: YedE family putative selenium transporter [Smithellaceae bacterium]